MVVLELKLAMVLILMPFNFTLIYQRAYYVGIWTQDDFVHRTFPKIKHMN